MREGGPRQQAPKSVLVITLHGSLDRPQSTQLQAGRRWMCRVQETFAVLRRHEFTAKKHSRVIIDFVSLHSVLEAREKSQYALVVTCFIADTFVGPQTFESPLVASIQGLRAVR